MNGEQANKGPSGRMTKMRAELLFMGGLVLALALVQSVGIRRPFLRQHESTGTEFGKHARNHLKFGLGKTFGLKLDVSGPRLDAYENYRDHFYSNHPPLPVLLLAGAFLLFGVGEVTFRGLLIVLSILSLVLFRRLAARLLRPPEDRVATVLFALFPMFVFYSMVTCLQVVGLVAILAALLFYARWREAGRRRDYGGIVASIVVACYSTWEGYYAAPALVVAHLWSRRPGRGLVLALLGVNVAVFGIYLLHLWAADPGRLQPLRSLGEAAFSRSGLKGLSFPAYVAGEAREIALMFTIPAVLLAGLWIVSVVRGPRSESDGFIAGLSLLGLHEVVFAMLASQHEYYSYFLAVFFGLAAARGASIAAARLRPLPPAAFRASMAILTLAFLGQSAWVLHRRLTREGGYVFYQRLGVAMREVALPDEKMFILTNNIPFYTPYYGDRYSRWYDAPQREIRAENTGPARKDVSEEGLLRLLRENPERLDWAVTAEKPTALAAIPWLRNLEDGQLETFGVETRPTPRRELLERRYGPPREQGGFLFWDLRRGR